MINRVVLFIMDSVGIGALPDADQFGDVGSNTLGNISKVEQGIALPNLTALGLGNIEDIQGVNPVESPKGAYGKSAEVSNGKDTTTGHWELVGLEVTEPFNTYPQGFPADVVENFEKQIGRKMLGNKPASGTVILDELGKEHMQTGHPIVYTSADSVFQIAAHEEVILLGELYKMCEIAREIMRGDHAVARVIARPFVGDPGNFIRTSNRRDYSLDPFGKTLLDIAKEAGKDVIGIGKIEDIFNGNGITEAIHTKDNMDGIDQTIAYLKKENKGIIFTNLVDFDSKYGHRRDPKGYKQALEEMDRRIPEILSHLNDEDLIIFTADHGNDPTFKGSDHTREYIPIVIYGKQVKAGVNIGTRKSFADIAATISDILNIDDTGNGESFKKFILE
ncbi:phosphopentomutase [Alkaliphilus metalliredigens QYMF]|uniref:Phosphopentomutase n=1 Tax=Alkaliphilus metalliredigens (strain QYMF) TaxID=293826 RepID=DEOB_ALKMQ|nr:phosphopentomutase [Alkaliphilus metalliredigens]A6TR59.1 RecName: Full=Phosphopentomutase; AltName: Full=Phosphodeoxyribomutase [Alkaliphilus metalliredigens QYMF]ABR48677.1 phosphopentomutase [Alkaliphilus metalliredigens QYMF]